MAQETEPSELAALRDEVAMLRDLFQRRLFEDRARQQMYDELCAQLEFARSDLTEQFIAPLLQELLLLVDRVETLLRAAEMVNPTETSQGFNCQAATC
ncbi:MAG TPA: hypothetical protein VFQ77_19880 [Pseudonocardiaceae bacterium]|jgi:hypothetical protein|nr:hypothetical protein [Pseudonocardiaceae bacterium]